MIQINISFPSPVFSRRYILLLLLGQNLHACMKIIMEGAHVTAKSQYYNITHEERAILRTNTIMQGFHK
jgi:hypothetical protein